MSEEVSKQGARRASVVRRDHDVAVSLLPEDKPLTQLAEELDLESKVVYGSIWRLRKQELVEKVNVGSRTPNWHLTDAGRNFAEADVPVVEDKPRKKKEKTDDQGVVGETTEPAAPQTQGVPEPQEADSVPRF